MKKKKKYVKPEIEVIKVDTDKQILVTSCVCNNCQCSHTNNSGQGGNGSQAHCNCSNRPYQMLEIDETTN